VTQHFISIFKDSDAPAGRAKFLSRVFGIFSEEVVRVWAADLAHLTKIWVGPRSVWTAKRPVRLSTSRFATARPDSSIPPS
jgi:hypothetical protein